MRYKLAAVPLLALLSACATDVVQPVASSAGDNLSVSYSASQGAKKYPLVGPSASIFCANLAPSPFDDGSQVQGGFAIFNLADGTNTLSAVVSLKGAAPNTTYPIRLIQAPGSDCFDIDGYLTTNKQGNGTAQVTEVGGAGHAAQVIIDTGDIFGAPTYRATTIFTW